MKQAIALLGLFIAGWGYAQSIDLFLLGDGGKPKANDPTLLLLGQMLDEGGSEDVLLILGDNIYPTGLPPKEHKDRAEMERRLNAQLDLIKKFEGKAFILPGNHDWDSGKKDGWEALGEEERYVTEYLGNEAVFLPKGGCPGPIVIPLSDDLLLIILDTQYLIHPWKKPGEESDCEEKSTFESLQALERVIKENAHKKIIVAGHHPMYSHGPHGGHYTLRQHLFPLSDLNRKLLIPLPGLGSIYPLYRMLLGSRQDLNHPRYKVVKKNMVAAFTQSENLVYVSGHEHTLQYLKEGQQHYIISGAGTKSSPVKDGKGTVFAKEGIGFGKLSYVPDGTTELRFWDGPNQTLLYESKLFTKVVIPPASLLTTFDFKDSTVMSPISTKYGALTFQRKLLGNNYREVWMTPTELPVFNIGTEHGGLKILKMGGGNQTRSLRLEDSTGRQYVIRTLDKYTDKLLPLALQRTLVADVLQDEISGANPFGAFAVPNLAESAGIYHTNPKMVFIPDDPRFGTYQRLFAGTVVLYEERPTDEWAQEENFGPGDKIISTSDLLEKLHKDNDNQVDQPFALRSRLFDNLLGDWDRHDDQWRWVRIAKKGGDVYRPIPRDRDQAFYVNEGLIPWITSRKWALPNIEGFDEEIDYPAGFNTSGRFFDRTFLNELSWSDWEREIKSLQASLSDSVLENAFNMWPNTIQKQAAGRTIKALKSRRDHLLTSARSHYLFLSKEVEIVGSDEREYFLVERLNDEATKVTLYKRKKDGGQGEVLYERTFYRTETREIRLYGLDDEDVFELIGDTRKGIKIRIIGGTDKDEIIDKSHVSGLSKKTIVYDLKKSTQLASEGETALQLSDRKSVNTYNRTGFKYDKLLPLVSAQYNPDDGLFLGAGFIFTKHAWREEPFAYQHKLKGNLALETQAFNLYYSGTLNDVIGKWDLGTDITLQRPFGVSNYFGLGNNSYYDYRQKSIPKGNDSDAIDYYRIRFERERLSVYLTRSLGEKGLFQIGPDFQRYELESNKGTFLTSTTTDADFTRVFKDFQYAGFTGKIAADTRDHKQLPEYGIYTSATYSSYWGVTASAKNYQQATGEFRFYLSAYLPMRVTLASRVGATLTSGPIEFFNGAALGRDNLRGYRRTRFIGENAFYNNLDIRIKLASFHTYLFPGSLGLVGFHDVGRVWLDGESSKAWHETLGAGVWISPLNQWVLVFNMTFTEEENLPTVTLGFQF